MDRLAAAFSAHRADRNPAGISLRAVRYFVWQRPAVPTLAEPDFALTCWLFCGTLKSGFAVLALISGLAMAGVAIALKRGLQVRRWVTTSLGLATLPIGLLLIVAGCGPNASASKLRM